MKVTLHRGFTLIEVMIVVAIVAILAAVAFPSYTEYLRRGQMPEAFASLSDYRIKLEQYYQDRRNYGTGTCAAPGPSWNNFSPTARKYFRFSCTLTGGGQGYEMKAIGEAGRLGTLSVSKFEYTVTQGGDKKTIKFDGATVDWNCWAVKPADCP